MQIDKVRNLHLAATALGLDLEPLNICRTACGQTQLDDVSKVGRFCEIIKEILK
jgi:hypothetical protein